MCGGRCEISATFYVEPNAKKMKNTPIFLTIVMMLLTGCGVLRMPPPVQYAIRDSVSVTYKDSTIYHIDSIEVVVPREESSSVHDMPEPSHLETSLAESDAYVDDSGKLHHTLRNKHEERLLVPVPIPEHFLLIDNGVSHIERQVVTVEVEKKLTFLQKTFILLGKIAAVGLLLASIFLIVKYVLKPRLFH